MTETREDQFAVTEIRAVGTTIVLLLLPVPGGDVVLIVLLLAIPSSYWRSHAISPSAINPIMCAGMIEFAERSKPRMNGRVTVGFSNLPWWNCRLHQPIGV